MKSKTAGIVEERKELSQDFVAGTATEERTYKDQYKDGDNGGSIHTSTTSATKSSMGEPLKKVKNAKGSTTGENTDTKENGAGSERFSGAKRQHTGEVGEEAGCKKSKKSEKEPIKAGEGKSAGEMFADWADRLIFEQDAKMKAIWAQKKPSIGK